MMSSRRMTPAVTALQPVSAHTSYLVMAMSPVALAVHLAIATSLYIPVANAQASHTETSQVQSGELRSFDIPAGSLSATLTRFLRETGIFLISATALTQGKTSPGVQGEMSVEAALEQVLSDTGLQAVRDSQGQYTLQVASPNESIPEPQVEQRNQPVYTRTSDIKEQDAAFETITVTGDAYEGGYTTNTTSAATGLNLSLRETPQSVTVIGRQRMDDQALNSLGMILDQTPGISHSSGTDYAGYTYTYSRGYRIANFDVDGMPGTGGMSVGGLGGWYDVSALETAIYESVAIVRGASGLLQGAGDPSGSISLTRKRPTQTFQASIEAGLGSGNKRRTVGDISGALNQARTVRGRLVGVYNEGES